MAGRLSAVKVRALLAKGEAKRTSDGGNLYLVVTGPETGNWALRYMREGKAREMGLGAAVLDGRGAGLTLAEARDEAARLVRILRDGGDPLAARRTERAASQRQAEEAGARTFAAVADAYVTAHEAGWKTPRHARQWRGALARHAVPHIGTKPVAELTREDVLEVLKPLWAAKPETAGRLRGRLEAVLDFAAARGWREGENPARWRGGMQHLLPSKAKIHRTRHQPALPWQKGPVFLAELRTMPGVSALALEFIIATGVRTMEALASTWAEIDLEAGIWTVPALRTKTGKHPLRVPLNAVALHSLEAARALRLGSIQPEDLRSLPVFPGARDGKPLSQMSLLMLLRRMQGSDRETAPRWTDLEGREITTVNRH